MPAPVQRCDGCQFWRAHPPTPALGHCHRHAPQSQILHVGIAATSEAGIVFRPLTRKDDWCGEYKSA